MDSYEKMIQRSGKLSSERNSSDPNDLNDNSLMEATGATLDSYNFTVKTIKKNYYNTHFDVFVYDIENLNDCLAIDIDVTFGLCKYAFYCYYLHDEIIFYSGTDFNKFKIDVIDNEIEFISLIDQILDCNIPKDYWLVKRVQN
jgi:hypothetical protein